MIASSPTDLQQRPRRGRRERLRLCDAEDASSSAQCEGDQRLSPLATTAPESQCGTATGLTGRLTWRALARAADDSRPRLAGGAACRVSRRAQAAGMGSGQASTPLLREGGPIGVFAVTRPELRPFTDSRSRSWRRSRTRPSSPSRTRGCSRSWSGATRTRRRERWSSRRRPATSCASSPCSPNDLSPCWTRSPKAPPASARQGRDDPAGRGRPELGSGDHGPLGTMLAEYAE